MRNLCVDIGGTSIKYALIENNKLGEVFSAATPRSNNRVAIPKLLTNVISEIGNIDNIGIATAGQVNDGVIVYAADTIPDYTGCQLKNIIQQETGINTFVLNDIDGAALGELEFYDYKSFVVIAVGTGIGGALVVDNKLYQGNFGNPMEIGHMKISESKLKCLCGNTGCLEMEASTNALIRQYYELTNENKNGFEIMQLVKQEKKEALIVYKNVVGKLAKAIANLYYILDPGCVIIGGAISENNPEFIEDIEKSTKSYCNEFTANKVKVFAAKNGNKAALIGMNNYIKENN